MPDCGGGEGPVFLSQQPGKDSGFCLLTTFVEAEEVKILGSGIRLALQLISSLNLTKLFNCLSLLPGVHLPPWMDVVNEKLHVCL